jgi:hypothetical protein
VTTTPDPREGRRLVRRTRSHPPRPRTVYGHYLRALCLRQADRRTELIAELDRLGWDDANVVLDRTFEFALRRLFAGGPDDPGITGFVVRVQEMFGADNVPAAETEAIIRDALDPVNDSPAIVQDMDGVLFSTLTGLLILAITDALGYGEAEIDALVAAAERQAMRDGHHPALLSRTG